ncbi:MAG: hypothetical protein HZB71_02605 [Betaproteobacteria bacterium]|nr:hypothetical protein [Betaproteobacteria bacterium]
MVTITAGSGCRDEFHLADDHPARPERLKNLRRAMTGQAPEGDSNLGADRDKVKAGLGP